MPIERKNKVRVIVHGVLIPFIIYVVITAFTYVAIRKFSNGKISNTILIQGIANVFAFVVLLPIYIKFKKRYNIYFSKLSIRPCIYMIALAFSLCVIGNILINLIPIKEVNKTSEEIFEIVRENGVAYSLIIVSITVPLMEELLFRGFFYDTTKLISNDIFAIVITSFTFAMAHIGLKQWIYAFSAGLVLGYVRYKYNNIIYTIIMHLLINFTTIIFVEDILQQNDYKKSAYIVFIAGAMFIFTLYRIILDKNKS